MNLETVRFENNTLKIINQQVLPNTFEYIDLYTIDSVIDSIVSLKVRGAPAIGIVAAYGLYIHALFLSEHGSLNMDTFSNAAKKLKNARPTAVNLEWAINRLCLVFENNQSNTDEQILRVLLNTAISIHEEDKKFCNKIGQYGAGLIKDHQNILTHCNAGILATGGRGTALAPVYTAKDQGKHIHIFVDETRPVGQGARLTYWELSQNQIPATLISDNMVASLMLQDKIDIVLVGADRIATNGDIANKIGTYGIAVLAKYHKVPFYVAAPSSSFDLSIENGQEIIIEQRDKREILDFWDITNKDKYEVYNPAFDITPNDLISGIITEKGIISKPYKQNIKTII
jgi:methylthioribose-1-phosphate isomerase